MSGLRAYGSILTEYENFEDIFFKKECETVPESTRVTYIINLEKDIKSLFRPIYSLSERELRILRDYLTEKETIDWIRRSKSPAGAPILFIPKLDNSLRLCVDYRALNKVTTKNRHPLPLINESIDRLSGAKIYTKLDLRDTYHRIRIKKRDEWKTAFRTRYGFWEYIIIPFGLTNTPATFQAYINKALDGLLNTIYITYINDIYIYNNSIKEHTNHIRQILERLRKTSLYVKLSKCEFNKQEIAFLEYIVNVYSIRIDNTKI